LIRYVGTEDFVTFELAHECDICSCATRVPYSTMRYRVLVPRLRRVRNRRALTQDELAVRAGVSRTTVIRAERGEDIRQSNVRKLADALGVQPGTLQRPDR